jgi:hypothetical protein
VKDQIMNLDTHITLPFGGGKFRFHLTEWELFDLETGNMRDPMRRRAPIRVGEAYARLLAGRFEIDGEDVGLPGRAAYSVLEMNAIIEAALRGGEGGVTDAGEEINWKEYSIDSWMKEYVHPMPLAERWNLAVAVLGARIEGRKSDDAEA